MATILAKLALFSVLIAAAHGSNYDIDFEVFTTSANVVGFGQNAVCGNPAPGLKRMKRGIDAATLDLLPMDMTQNFGFKAPLFDHTCTTGQKVRLGQKSYDLPDEFSGGESVPGGFRKSQVEVFETVEEVEKTMKLSLGLGDVLGVVNLSPSLTYVHKTLTNSTKNVEEVSAFVSAYRADYNPPWSMTLNRQVQSFIDSQLGQSFQQNPKKYETFIKHFGTHYFTDASFGGILQLRVETEKTYFEKTTKTSVGLEAQGLFGQLVKAKGGVDVGRTQVNSEFKKASSESFRYFGGVTNLLDKSDMKNWVPTVADDPWLFRGQLQPIHDLIKDADKKKQLGLASQAHLDKAFLQRLLKTIQSVVAKIGPQKETAKLTKEINEELKKVLPDHAKVAALGKDTEYHAIIPKWFKDGVHLCFEWSPIYEHCGYYQNNLPKKLCAKIGEFTEEFMDQAYKSGSCYYSWKLDVIGGDERKLPDYFLNTQLCHSWTTRGAKIQCNGKIEDGEVCAKVGKSTPKYFDLTYMNDEGCDYRWMIRTPESAPMWLKNLSFCMKWRGKRNIWGKEPENPCGNYVEPETCSKSNSWTHAFNDNNRNDRGECFFSWALKHQRLGA